eukprot:scaffold83567_cov54-Phaeocystis_antarctica.AAC.2
MVLYLHRTDAGEIIVNHGVLGRAGGRVGGRRRRRQADRVLCTAGRLADHEPDLGTHRDGAELLAKVAANQRAVDRDQLVAHGNAAATLGLAILGDR